MSVSLHYQLQRVMAEWASFTPAPFMGFFSWMLFCHNSGLSNTCSSCYLVFSAGTCPYSPKVSGFPTANNMTHEYIQISLTLLELAVASSTLSFSFHLTFCLNIQKAICLGAARTYPVLLRCLPCLPVPSQSGTTFSRSRMMDTCP